MMERGVNRPCFNMNSAKSIIGRTVNLHMKDDSVVVNVKISQVRKTLQGNMLSCTSRNGHQTILLKFIAWAEPIQVLKEAYR